MRYHLLSRKKSLHYLIIFIVFQAFFSCKTDIDINAPYKETTIVYGLLNASDAIHYIKINKTFLGKESAYTMAARQDSSDYNTPHTPSMTATVEEWKGGTIQRTWVLDDTLITNKETGTFRYPEQTLYYFVTDTTKAQAKLDASAQYRLTVNVNEGEKLVTAKTPVIGSFFKELKIGASCPSGGGTCLAFYSNNDYRDAEFKWTSVKNGKRYQLKMTFNYKEYYTDATPPADKSIDWLFQPPVQSNTANGGQQLSIPVKGEDFYTEIQRQLEPLTTNKIKKREFDGGDEGKGIVFSLYVAADEFNTYLLANEPSTSIIQEKQEYTNIDNGIGIFSSRIAVATEIKKLRDESLVELASGTITQSLKFCATVNGQKYGTCE